MSRYKQLTLSGGRAMMERQLDRKETLGPCDIVGALSCRWLQKEWGNRFSQTNPNHTHHHSPDLTLTPDIKNVDPALVCPTARGVGTVSPAVSIYSITFLVNGIEQTMLQNNILQAVSGDEVQIREVIICAKPSSGNGGQACVDFAPTDESGQEIMSEHKGTDTVPVTPGLIRISDLNFTWTVGENWSGFYAVLNHWPSLETQDLGCASGGCERDDWLIIRFK